MVSNDLQSYEDRKRDFAYTWLMYPDEPEIAAREVAGDNVTALLAIRSKWVSDPVVLQHRKELIAIHGEEHFLPTKADIARKLLDEIDAAVDPEVKLKFYKLYADIRGYTQKDTVNINNNVITQNKVMLVPTAQNDEDWETKLANQQSQLMIECAAIDDRTGA